MAQEIKMPNLGSDMEEGILLNWTKQVGEAINEGDVIAEIETDKATVEVPATASGTIIKLIGEPGQTLKVGSVIGYVGAQGENAPANGASNGGAPKPAPTQASAAAAAEQTAPASAVAADSDGGNYPDGVKASPVARKIAAERGINLTQVQGTGPGGRIVKADVEGFEPGAAPAAAAAPARTVAAPSYGTIPSGADVRSSARRRCAAASPPA
ncbi:MAG: biotin/lipoyl-containing protein [Anaerolineae bacterium]